MKTRNKKNLAKDHIDICFSVRKLDGPNNLWSMQTGLQLIELIIGIAVLGILLSIAMPMFNSMQKKSDDVKAAKYLNTIAITVDNYYLENGKYPDSLADIKMDHLRDPWGNPYQYLKIEGCECKEMVRKDKSLHPLNTDYDLYSMGEDGITNIPLTAKASRDDIIRANNGKFVGIAEDY